MPFLKNINSKLTQLAKKAGFKNSVYGVCAGYSAILAWEQLEKTNNFPAQRDITTEKFLQIIVAETEKNALLFETYLAYIGANYEIVKALEAQKTITLERFVLSLQQKNITDEQSLAEFGELDNEVNIASFNHALQVYKFLMLMMYYQSSENFKTKTASNHIAQERTKIISNRLHKKQLEYGDANKNKGAYLTSLSLNVLGFDEKLLYNYLNEVKEIFINHDALLTLQLVNTWHAIVIIYDNWADEPWQFCAIDGLTTADIQQGKLIFTTAKLDNLVAKIMWAFYSSKKTCDDRVFSLNYLSLKDHNLNNIGLQHKNQTLIYQLQIFHNQIISTKHISKHDARGYSPLCLASHRGLQAQINTLIAYGADCNIKGREGQTLLHWAAMYGEKALICYYLDNHKLEVNVQDKNGDTPLHFATREGNLDVIKLLHEKGANLDEKNKRGETVLHIAAAGGHLKIIKYCVAQKSDINEKNNKGWNLASYAACYGHLEIIKYCKAQNLNIHHQDNDHRHLVFYAAYGGHLEVIKYCEAQKLDIRDKDDNGLTIMHTAATRGHLNIIKCCIAQGMTIDESNENKLKKTLLHSASQSGHLEVIQYCLLNKIDIHQKDTFGATPLIWAAFNGHLDAVKYLIANGAEIEEKDHKGYTPLLSAAEQGQLEIFKYLLELGADINAQNHQGATSLICAINKGQMNIIRYLDSLELDFRATVVKELTLLHQAATSGHLVVIKYLLIKKRFEVDEQNSNGVRALHFAIFNGHLNIVKYLVEQGANITQKHNILGTPLALAKKIKIQNKNEIIEYLENELMRIANTEEQKTHSQVALLGSNSLLFGKRQIEACLVRPEFRRLKNSC